MVLKQPVKSIPSEHYSAVLQDADDVTHFWLPNGDYDGYSRDITDEGDIPIITNDGDGIY